MTYQEEVDEQGLNKEDWKDGNPIALKALFIRQYPIFYEFAISLLRDRTSAQEMTLEAFYLLWQKRAGLDDGKNIKAFLYRQIRDGALGYLKHLQLNASAGPYKMVYYPDVSLPESIIEEMRDYVARGV